MQPQSGKSPYFPRAGAARGILPLLITGIAVVLFSTAGIARMMGWGPGSTGESGGIVALDREAPSRCPECGMIVSMREIERHDEDSGPGAAAGVTAANRDEIRVNTTRSYEITVRMADGSSRVIYAANPARWRTGERLIVIAGAIPPHQ